MNFRFLSKAISFGLAVVLLGACSGESEEAGHVHGHEAHADCAAIMELCHAVNGMSELATDCHGVAHDDQGAECGARKDECRSHCASLGDPETPSH